MNMTISDATMALRLRRTVKISMMRPRLPMDMACCSACSRVYA
jgi:hypothetical protein